MKTTAAIAVLLSACFPRLAPAENTSLSASASVVSEYVSQGFELSGGPAFQPYLELDYKRAYAAIDASNVSQELSGADVEIDFYLGYRWTMKKFSFDAAYGYYAYTNITTADEFGEFTFTADYSVNEKLSITGYIGYAPEYFDQLDRSLSVTVDTGIKNFSATATYGAVSTGFGDWDYYTVGTSYKVNDKLSFGLDYWGASDSSQGLGVTDGILVASANYYFDPS
ncbi:MAG: hypothetical protein AAF636_15225 [Pseudomonadota bacterium]